MIKKNLNGDLLPDSGTSYLTRKSDKKTSLDEIPQCDKCIKGDIDSFSLQDHYCQNICRFITKFKEKELKPGITGWATDKRVEMQVEWNKKFEV